MTKHERIASTERELPRLCNVHTVARELDCGISKVYKMLKAGLIPTVKVDEMVRVPREALEDYIRQCAKNSGLENTADSGSQSADMEKASKDVDSALRLDRITRQMPSARSTS